MLSTSLLFILALPQLLFVKNKLKNKIGYLLAIGVCLALLLNPFFSRLFSAFSSITYRWNFFLVFLIVLTIGYFLQNYSKQRKIYYLGLIISAIIVNIGWYYSYKILRFQNVIPDFIFGRDVSAEDCINGSRVPSNLFNYLFSSSKETNCSFGFCCFAL